MNLCKDFRNEWRAHLLPPAKLLRTTSTSRGHPFGDGNSRRVRLFTKQLAHQSGYEVDWERFGRSDIGRDLLYVARANSVNAVAMPHVQHESTRRKLISTKNIVDSSLAPSDLMRDVVKLECKLGLPVD